MSESADMRPRGIVGTMHNGTVMGVAIADTPKGKPKHVDGDDMTWDWWQALGEAGYFTLADDGIGLEVNRDALYDLRTGPQRLEHIITELVQRVETLEAIIRSWSGD